MKIAPVVRTLLLVYGYNVRGCVNIVFVTGYKAKYPTVVILTYNPLITMYFYT